MSTGKRLAKRSIIGTRVCAPGEDGKFYSGVIQAVKTPASFENNNCINLTPNTRYTVRFDSRQGTLGRTTAEFFETDLIGPGFKSVIGLELVEDQKCFVTFNGREVTGEVCKHHIERDEVIIRIHPPGSEAPFEVQKRMDEVRLLESRKSARLADQDQDFARLADMGGDRKRTASHTIDVPAISSVQIGSRKRRPSNSQDDRDPQMDECSAALVLMSLSCSPGSPNGYLTFSSAFSSSLQHHAAPASPKSDHSSSSISSRSSPSPPPWAPRHDSPSPPPRMHSPQCGSFTSDEGIFMDYLEETPRKKKKEQTPVNVLFQCTWPNCSTSTNTCEDIEAHVRNEHLNDRVVHAGEEEFYYTEVELIGILSPGPTLSHRDMAKPPHEDPDYQRQLIMRHHLYSGPMPIPQSPHKLLKLAPTARPHSPKLGPPSPAHRRVRGENKKCRKIYGMDHKDQWCTQCKWKKACSRFGD